MRVFRRELMELIYNLLSRMDEGNSPKWTIFLLDISIALFSIVIAFLLRFNFELENVEKAWLLYAMGFVLVIRGGLFLTFKTYAHIIRYTSSLDILRLVTTACLGSFILLCCSLGIRAVKPFTVLPLSVIIIELVLTIFLLTNVRLALKFIYRRSISPLRQSLQLLIVGSKEKAMLTKEAIEIDRCNRYRVIAFLDSKNQVRKERIAGHSLHPLEDLEQLIACQSIHAVILAKEDLLERQKERIASLCNSYHVKLIYAPEEWLQSDSPKIEMTEINLEELLTRDPINLDKKHLHKHIKGRTILVTGAAGSIGSELVRQITRYHPRHIILLDQSESPLYELELELREKFRFSNFSVVLADILQKTRIEKLFETFHPDTVYHAAAYKHVPMLEFNPVEALRNNVEGTKIVADLSNR